MNGLEVIETLKVVSESRAVWTEAGVQRFQDPVVERKPRCWLLLRSSDIMKAEAVCLVAL